MLLGTEVGLGTGHIVLDGDPVPPSKRSTAPIFVQCLLCPRLDVSTCYFIRGYRPQSRRHCVIDGIQLLQLPLHKNGNIPTFSLCLLWPNDWVDQFATRYGDGPRPRPHFLRRGPSSSRTKRGTTARHFSTRACLLWPNGRPSQLMLSSC